MRLVFKIDDLVSLKNQFIMTDIGEPGVGVMAHH